jgi:hypothetical protein
MQRSGASRLAALAFAMIVSAPCLGAQCNPNARKVVEQFMRFDFDGYEFGSEGHQAIWDLTDRDGEPQEGPIVITKDFAVESEKLSADGVCHLSVRYTVFGTLHEAVNGDLSLRAAKPSERTGSVDVNCKDALCRIGLDLKRFKMHSHPGKLATMDWLKELVRLEEKPTARARMLERLRSQVSLLP